MRVFDARGMFDGAPVLLGAGNNFFAVGNHAVAISTVNAIEFF